MHNWESGRDAYEHSDHDNQSPVLLWPTETSGNGKYRKNNLRTGSAQGEGTLKRKAQCKQCGFLIDAATNDHSGGSLDGNGAGGQIVLSFNVVSVSGGGSYTEYVGDQIYNKGSGCPGCFSRNSLDDVSPLIDEAPTGPEDVGF